MKNNSFRINCGSLEDFTDQQGQIWLADRRRKEMPQQLLDVGDWFCLGGNSVTREEDLPLYPVAYSGLLRTECYDLDAYYLQLDPGSYDVHLWVAETFETWASQDREVSVSISGQHETTTFCPFQVAGGHSRVGIVKIRGVQSGATPLVLSFSKQANIYGLEILPSSESGTKVSCEALAPHPLSKVKHSKSPFYDLFFIGHSGTFYWAIPETIARMVEIAPLPYGLKVEGTYHGGKNAQFFAESVDVQDRLLRSEASFVVLQDSSRGPIESSETFEKYMPKLIEKVIALGKCPILYAYSGPLMHSEKQRQNLMDLYLKMGQRYQVPVIPCASALISALKANPIKNFHNPDKNHLGMRAGFLYACTWFRALTGYSASSLPEMLTLGGHVHVPINIALELIPHADAACESIACGITPEMSILGQSKFAPTL